MELEEIKLEKWDKNNVTFFLNKIKNLIDFSYNFFLQNNRF